MPPSGQMRETSPEPAGGSYPVPFSPCFVTGEGKLSDVENRTFSSIPFKMSSNPEFPKSLWREVLLGAVLEIQASLDSHP